MPFAMASNSEVKAGTPSELDTECTMFPGNNGMGTASVAKVKKMKNTKKIAPPLIFTFPPR